MKQMILICLVLSIGVSCTPILQRNTDYKYPDKFPKWLQNRCDSTGMFIKDSWHYNPKTKLYEIKHRKIKNSEIWADYNFSLKTCGESFVIGKDKKTIARVFGANPHIKRDTLWLYSMNERSKIEPNSCDSHQLQVVFDKKTGLVTEFFVGLLKCGGHH